jgi:alpha-1,2-mannosyltransferase
VTDQFPTTRATTADPRPSWPSTRGMVLAVVTCAVVVTLGAWGCGLFDGMIDLRVYRMGGSILLDHGSLYDALLPGTDLPFTYPPFAAVAMVPLATLPWQVAVVAWTTVSVLCLAMIWRSSLPASAWVLLPNRRKNRWVLVLATLTALSLVLEPVWETIRLGQINLLLTAMILFDLVRPERRRWRGAWVGVAIGIKLTPLPFLAFLLVTRQWRALRNAVTGLLATMVIGFVIVPHQSWEYWTVVIRNADRVGNPAFTGNQSFMGFLTRIGGEAAYVKPLWFLLSATFGLVVLWLAHRFWSAGDRVAAISVMALAVLYASPVSWSHHWVWVVPLGVSLARSVYRHWFRLVPAAATAAVWFGLFCLRSIWWVPYRDGRELNWTFWQSIPGNAHLILGMVSFGLLAFTSRSLRPVEPVPVLREAAQAANSSRRPPTV